MPSYNIEYKGKWACFTSIADGFVTEFLPREEYDEWRIKEYGVNARPLENANQMTMQDAVRDMYLHHPLVGVIQELKDLGICENEIRRLVGDPVEDLLNTYEFE